LSLMLKELLNMLRAVHVLSTKLVEINRLSIAQPICMKKID
jgi:hypothetical protein